MKTLKLSMSKRVMFCFRVIAIGFVAFSGSSYAQRNLPLDAIPKPDPSEQIKTFVLDEGLEINLFASDPMIAKPIGMNWDEKGRLWVVSSRLYPHIKPGQRSDDKVVVLEDLNGDGVADKSTDFAKDLLIPTGIMPGDGGVYVANSTEILFLRDLDGDLKEDQRRVVLSGFGTEDTHHIIHAFRGGPDGMMYFNQSIYIHSHVETPHGVRRLMAGGIWHYRPETGELEVFSRGFVNSWGHIFDRYGQSFATDGAYGEGINYVFPGSVFVTAYNTKRIMRGLNPGQPKQCGLEIVNSSHFPDEWQGNLITNDFRGHRVNRFVMSESGSGYVSRQAPDLIRTTHKAFRPIDVKVGPDGALYIADWYNPIIQHGEVDFRDPRRDQVHGRIWRITYKGRKLSQKPKFGDQGIREVVNQLKSPDSYTRHFAKRNLRLRKKSEVIRELKLLERSEGITEEDRLEILWANQAVNELNESLLKRLLASKDHRIRAAAVRVLYHWSDRLEGHMDFLGKAIIDDHPRVRLEAVSALRQVGTVQSFEVILKAFTKDIDANMDFALWLSAREMESIWLPALEKGEISFGGNTSALEFILKAAGKPSALKLLSPSLTSLDIPSAGFRELVSLFADIGNAEDLDLLHSSAFYKDRNNEDRNFVFKELIRADQQRQVRPREMRKADLLELLVSGNSAVAELCGSWKILEARKEIIKWLKNDERVEIAASSLSSMADEESKQALLELAGDESRGILQRSAAVGALTRLDPIKTSELAAQVLVKTQTAQSAELIFEAYLAKEKASEHLAAALSGKKMNTEVAAAGVRKSLSSGGDTSQLVEALSKSGSLQPIVNGLSDEEMKSLMNEVQSKGDAVRGENIYRRNQLLCQACHAIGGGGGLIGPDLVSIGSSAPVDYIIDSLLEPAKKIKEGYHTTVITTKGGDLITGGLMREADREIVLRMADGSERKIAKVAIKKKEISPISLMPPGLTASLRKDEFIDLVRFLSSLGKEGKFKVPSGRYVRRWRVLPSSGKVGNLIRTKGIQYAMNGKNDLPWRAAYSQVNAELPIEEIGINNGFNNKLGAAKFEISVSVPGEIGLSIDDTKGLQVIVGGKMIEASAESVFNLSKGLHDIIFITDRAVRESNLKVQLFDVDGSSGRASLVGGP
ncbi:MAG: PVC-type heme-binding CxxCH protein [Verrucomicrobiota bacterium]|nr:PVC-type heme-binding CxxCH protein [Verrucomicrobiota bacterium]